MANSLVFTGHSVYKRIVFESGQMVVIDSEKWPQGEERDSVLEILTEVRDREKEPNSEPPGAPVERYAAIICGSALFFPAINFEFSGEAMKSLNKTTYDLTDCWHTITVQGTLIAGKGKQVGLYAGDGDADKLLALIDAAGWRHPRDTWVFPYPMHRVGPVWKVPPTGTPGEKIVLAACDRSGDQREDRPLQWLDADQNEYLASLNPDRTHALLKSANICKKYNFRVSRGAGVDRGAGADPFNAGHKPTLFYGFNKGTQLGPIKMEVFLDRSCSTCFKCVDKDPNGDGETLEAFLDAANISSRDTVVFCPVRWGGPGEGYFVARGPSAIITVVQAERMFNRQ
jgi:hypothetical protein